MDKLNEQPTKSNPLEHVVMWQFRFRIANEYCVDYGTWYPWENCDKNKHKEVKYYIDNGNDNYEVRELIVAT